MENFQLYRTNLHIGGQMKWDIVINNSSSKLFVSDFHLRPISDNIPYSYKSDELLLNNSHQDNVKSYYNSIRGNFYSEGLDSEFKHNWPIICKEGEIINAYSNIYDMGCKRMKHYSLYKRQFEFFCPVWIEKMTSSLVFKIIVKPHNSNNVLSSKTLDITNEINDEFAKTHNKFVSYFRNYVNDAKLNEGDDNVLNIQFNTGKSVVHGLNVESGLFSTKNIIGFVNDLKSIERPIMETDLMLAKAFSGNNIVTKQLFNFNICFNLSDIISDVIFKMLNGERLSIDVEVYVDGEKLERKDFYTNYTFIDRSVKNAEDNEKYNVFDYLKDYKSLDLINKNKFCQSIFHWSLADDNNYLFNLYDGFSGLFVESVGTDNYIYHENSHQYKDFPNLFSGEANTINNSTGWINTESITHWNGFYKYVSNTEKNKKRATYINGNTFINGIKYKNLSKITHNGQEGVYVIGLCVTNKIFRDIENSVDRLKLVRTSIVENKIILLRKDDLLMLIVKNINDLTYKNMSLSFLNRKDIIEGDASIDDAVNKTDEKKFLKVLFELFTNLVSPEIITFNNTLKYTTVTGPTKDVDEIEYIKSDDFNYVCRYDGKLKPTFISENMNELYFKDYVSDNRVNGVSKLTRSSYMKYLNTGFEPTYPSIGFFPIKKIENWNYDSLPIISSSEGDNPVINDIEYSWFEDNVCLLLEDKLKFRKINTKQDGYKTLKEILVDCIKEYYKITDKRLADFIISKYDISSDWEYESIHNVDDYIYDITLTLK